MALHEKVDDHEECEDWLVTYSDAITLLMAFFVMLVSMSKIDLPLFEQVMAGISTEIGKREHESPIVNIKLELQKVVNEEQQFEVVSVETDSQGIVMELDSKAFFDPGAADLKPAAKPFLDRIVQTIGSPRFEKYMLEVEGHTDPVPITTDHFPSNWELSAQRASAVVRFFAEAGFRAWRLKATGFADTMPKVPNYDGERNPLPDNMAKNRRVAVRIRPMELGELTRLRRDHEVEALGAENRPPPLIEREMTEDEKADQAAREELERRRAEALGDGTVDADGPPADAPVPSADDETPSAVERVKSFFEGVFSRGGDPGASTQ